jgi:beta-galactosidase
LGFVNPSFDHVVEPARQPVDRRALLRSGVLAAAAVPAALSGGAALAAGIGPDATSGREYDFNRGWLFGGIYAPGSEKPGYDESRFSPVTVPHTVTSLSWSRWDPSRWQNVFIYRKHFQRPARSGSRVLLDFDGVMTSATVVLNGHVVSTHQGGYLGWTAELTHHLQPGRNLVAVIVDDRWLPVPPSGSRLGPRGVDWLQPGGIYRDVRLRVVPQVFLSDVFARPVNVLSSGRSVSVAATLDAARVPGRVTVTAALMDGSRTVAAASAHPVIRSKGTHGVHLELRGIGSVGLWSPDSPRLYSVRVTVRRRGGPAHTMTVRVGFREAEFRVDGFFLNGQRYKIFGLNRHQLFPYTGMAAPARLQRRDAEILRKDLNCNMVRCSHYPQSPHFLDACDELGMMVWQEPPGWAHVGNAAWQHLFLRDVRDMIIRDRNRPSVIMWATRLNETDGHAPLYGAARRLAGRLDPSRPTTAAMAVHSTADWAEDVFGFNDYRKRQGSASLDLPLPRVPYLVSEAVGVVDGSATFRWTDSGATLSSQALMHAQVHDKARSSNRYAGLLGWAALDYATMAGGHRSSGVLKTPGVLDTFRTRKPGAAFYQSQVPPSLRPVIEPAFLWDFGPGSPQTGPGPDSLICTNCDKLVVYVGGKRHATVRPDRDQFPHLRYPPAVVNLQLHGTGLPDLRIDGYVGGRKVKSVTMSCNPAKDQLQLRSTGKAIQGDGSDATWVTFRVTDQHGNHRPGASGLVHLSVTGPAELVGDNPFSLAEAGGVGGVFVRSRPGQTGVVHVSATHQLPGATSRILRASSVRLSVHRPRGRFL